MQLKKINIKRLFLVLTVIACLISAVAVLLIGIFDKNNRIDSFSERCITLSEGWTLTADGESRSVTLPYTADYGTDGMMILTSVLPDDGDIIGTPVLRVYSNYTSFTVNINGKTVFAFPEEAPVFSPATGNTYHFIRLESDWRGAPVEIRFHGQIGDSISYYLRAPVLGAKATMLYSSVTESLPFLFISGCVLLLAAEIFVLLFVQKRSGLGGSAALNTAIFALLFALYVFCETRYAQYVFSSSYLLYTMTFILLALIPMPIIGFFADMTESKSNVTVAAAETVCLLNFILQFILHITGTVNMRAMLPFTHGAMIFSIVIMFFSMLFVSKENRSRTYAGLLTALPMAIGGITDILLLWLKKPSLNNSLYFILGVTLFLVIRFIVFVNSFFAIYRSSIESQLLRKMAYSDELTGLGNRNAYEEYLSRLADTERRGTLRCLIADLNELKRINDDFGHRAGDTALSETGRLISRFLPQDGKAFRTGGDEFAVLFHNEINDSEKLLADRLYESVNAAGEELGLPIKLAIGYGVYSQQDANLRAFISRIDTQMYCEKNKMKRKSGGFGGGSQHNNAVGEPR